jgi:hypothetical protein
VSFAITTGCAADLYFEGLVAVHLGGVDVPEPGLERRAQRGHRVLRLDQEDSEAELGDALPVVQRDAGNGGSSSTKPPAKRFAALESSFTTRNRCTLLLHEDPQRLGPRSESY